MKITVEAPELARALSNALAFIPAASKIQHALIVFTKEAVFTVGTDGYAAGTETAPVSTHEGLADRFTVLVDKDGLTELERMARGGKKEIAEIGFAAGSISVTSQSGTVSAPTFVLPAIQNALEAIAGMIAEAEKRSETIPGLVMLDPALLSRFAKVKADKGDRRADFLFGVEGEPILVKVGPTFKGLIMPIDREVHSDNVGEDGLW